MKLEFAESILPIFDHLQTKNFIDLIKDLEIKFSSKSEFSDNQCYIKQREEIKIFFSNLNLVCIDLASFASNVAKQDYFKVSKQTVLKLVLMYESSNAFAQLRDSFTQLLQDIEYEFAQKNKQMLEIQNCFGTKNMQCEFFESKKLESFADVLDTIQVSSDFWNLVKEGDGFWLQESTSRVPVHKYRSKIELDIDWMFMQSNLTNISVYKEIFEQISWLDQRMQVTYISLEDNKVTFGGYFKINENIIITKQFMFKVEKVTSNQVQFIIVDLDHNINNTLQMQQHENRVMIDQVQDARAYRGFEEYQRFCASLVVEKCRESIYYSMHNQQSKNSNYQLMDQNSDFKSGKRQMDVEWLCDLNKKRNSNRIDEYNMREQIDYHKFYCPFDEKGVIILTKNITLDILKAIVADRFLNQIETEKILWQVQHDPIFSKELTDVINSNLYQSVLQQFTVKWYQYVPLREYKQLLQYLLKYENKNQVQYLTKSQIQVHSELIKHKFGCILLKNMIQNIQTTWVRYDFCVELIHNSLFQEALSQSLDAVAIARYIIHSGILQNIFQVNVNSFNVLQQAIINFFKDITGDVIKNELINDLFINYKYEYLQILIDHILQNVKLFCGNLKNINLLINIAKCNVDQYMRLEYVISCDLEQFINEFLLFDKNQSKLVVNTFEQFIFDNFEKLFLDKSSKVILQKQRNQIDNEFWPKLYSKQGHSENVQVYQQFNDVAL